jgi:hypothetical protein
MIRNLVLAVLLVSSGAAAMRLNPLAVSNMVEDRRPGATPAALPSISPQIPVPLRIGLKPWPETQPQPWLRRAACPIDRYCGEISPSRDVWRDGAPSLLRVATAAR